MLTLSSGVISDNLSCMTLLPSSTGVSMLRRIAFELLSTHYYLRIGKETHCRMWYLRMIVSSVSSRDYLASDWHAIFLSRTVIAGNMWIYNEIIIISYVNYFVSLSQLYNSLITCNHLCIYAAPCQNSCVLRWLEFRYQYCSSPSHHLGFTIMPLRVGYGDVFSCQ